MFASEWFKHGIPSPQIVLVSSAAKRLALIRLLDHYIYLDKPQVAKIRHRDVLDDSPPGCLVRRTGSPVFQEGFRFDTTSGIDYVQTP